MKKLIIAFAAVAMAACAQAAVVSWSSTTPVVAHSTSVNATANLVTMYCWEITASQYATYAALSGTKLSDAINADFNTSSAEKAFASTGRGITTGNGTTTHNQNDTVYGVVLFVDSGDNYYLGNVVTATIPNTGNGKFENLAKTYGGTASSGSLAWSTVPEPTSGLLLLLGMAGLALRRRRS